MKTLDPRRRRLAAVAGGLSAVAGGLSGFVGSHGAFGADDHRYWLIGLSRGAYQFLVEAASARKGYFSLASEAFALCNV